MSNLADTIGDTKSFAPTIPVLTETEKIKTFGGGDDPLLDTHGAAQYLGGLKPRTLIDWRSSGKFAGILPYVKIGGRVRYRKSALDAFLAAQTKGNE